jgi:hypothetical protein
VISWKTIDSAPKTGEWIFLIGGIGDFTEDEGPPVVVAQFIDLDEGFWSYSYNSENFKIYENPTHWAEIEAWGNEPTKFEGVK